MHLDKLQIVATTPVASKHKVMWLQWWNSGLAIRDTYWFPKPPCAESQLVSWLHKATFYAGVITSIKPILFQQLLAYIVLY
jgi:hypothetical protein